MPILEEAFASFNQSGLTGVVDAVAHRFPDTRARMENYMTGAGELDTTLIADLSARGTVALYVADTLRRTTETAITAARVFADFQSTPQEQAAAVLRCFSSFTMLAGLTGPMGLAVGTTVSTLIGVITLILEATSSERESEMHKLEGLLRSLKAQDAENEVRAAQGRLNTQLRTVQSFEDGSKTWDGLNSILLTAPILSDISQFMLSKTGEWLRNPENAGVERWEEVFMAYSETVIQVITLQTTMLMKLREHDREIMMTYIREYGTQMESWFGDLRNTVDGCGEYWHTTLGKSYGCHVKNPWQPPRNNDGWEDINVGQVGTIAVSPQTDRIWATSIEREWPLITGKAGDTIPVSEGELAGCIDVCVVPWAAQDTDLLLVTSKGAHGNEPGHLSLNQWHEKRSRFYTSSELRSGSEKGFTGKWRPTDIKGGSIVMVRAFHFTSPSTPVSQRCGYVVQMVETPGSSRSYSLGFFWLHQLDQSIEFPVTPVAIPIPKTGGLPFRISTSGRYLYLFTRRGAWRIPHMVAMLHPGISQWQTVTMPADLTDRDGGLDQQDQPDWRSNGINDLYAWADDHVICVLKGSGEIWNGDFDAAERRKWEDFDVDYTSRPNPGAMPQNGRSLIVIAEVQNRLHFRVFDENRNILVDTDETQVSDLGQLDALKRQLKPHETPTAQEKHAIIKSVTALVGATWRWKRLSGLAKRVLKHKSASHDYCKWLYEAGANLKAGEIHPRLPAIV
jgi:hypothetical protein